MGPGRRTAASQPCLGQTLYAEAVFLGADLSAAVYGGDLAHVGSVSIGIPRESLTGSGEMSATVSTYNVTGHLDGHVGDRFAKALAARFNCRAAVTCGIHYDNAEPAALTEIREAADRLLSALLRALERC